MKKLVSIIAITAIVAMLFTACAPQPATEEDIAIANELVALVEAAGSAGYIDEGNYMENPMDYTMKLKETYKAANGDQLTAYTYNYKVDLNETNIEASKVTINYSATGIINGKPHTLTLSGTVTGANPDNANIKVTIDGKNIDPDSLTNIPG